ncbi:MAG: helix-turn-helix transcriptional regulator [Clostridia bacterium]|nr:helix-turn-helix transcriptional regulator [Clostridia bacterium]
MIIGRVGSQCNICGKRVREAREKLRLSQDQLAARLQTEGLGVNQNSISRIETGKRIVADFELVALSKVLGVGMEWLVQGSMQDE